MNTLYRALKQPFFGRYRTSAWRWPENVGKAAWEPTRFESPSGARLSGLMARAGTNALGRGVVLAHPASAAAKGFFLKNGLAAMLQAAGFDVLLFDFNGFGESDTGNFDYPADLIAAGKHLAAETGTREIGVLGVSFGAAWATCALSRPEHPFVAAVLESPFARLEEYWVRHPLAYVVLRGISLARPALASRLRPVDRIADLRGIRAALLVYGERDDITPVSVGERLLGAGASACRDRGVQLDLWVVPGAEHLKAFSVEEAAYRARVLPVLGAPLS